MPARLAEERVHEQAAAHADPAMDAPHGELNSGLFQSFPPRQHMLIDAVDQRAVKIEQKRHLAVRSFRVFQCASSHKGAEPEPQPRCNVQHRSFCQRFRIPNSQFRIPNP